jgi:ionotropic kainate glutamate receptor 1
MELNTVLALPGLWTRDTSWALLYFLCSILPQTAPQVLRIGE